MTLTIILLSVALIIMYFFARIMALTVQEREKLARLANFSGCPLAAKRPVPCTGICIST